MLTLIEMVNQLTNFGPIVQQATGEMQCLKVHYIGYIFDEKCVTAVSRSFLTDQCILVVIFS